MENVLITGATGMLGSSLKELAINRAWSVVTPTRSELDLTDQSSTSDYLRDYSIKTVIHCAAKVGGIQANIDFPADFILENTQIDNSIINAARIHKVSKLIYFGSSCMYPKLTVQPMAENMILSGELEPTNEGYALAKIVAAKAVKAVAAQDNLNWRVLIPSNLYGPKDNFNLNSSHLIPAAIRKVSAALRNNESSIEIWGTGNARREFTYVYDVAEFVLENLENCHSWDYWMNIGIGRDYSINEYYKIVARILGYAGEFTNNLTKPEGMFQKLMDSSIAKKHGWDPKTNLNDGLERTINWFQSQNLK
jgi:GDP-L-fucose synthase